MDNLESVFDNTDTDPILVEEDGKIKTVFVIKNGSVSVGSIEELKKKNYFFRLHSRVDGVAVIDYDKTDMTPFVKDILNRQNQFVEIKYLKGCVALLAFLIVLVIGSAYIVYWKNSWFDVQKNEIVNEIRKMSTMSKIDKTQSSVPGLNLEPEQPISKPEVSNKTEVQGKGKEISGPYDNIKSWEIYKVLDDPSTLQHIEKPVILKKKTTTTTKPVVSGQAVPVQTITEEYGN